jgi:AmmeMemoRadiSam system protein A
VEDVAISAAINDPRFPPVSKGELDKLEFEVSVLTPFRLITDVNEIEVGKHGLFIVKGRNSGVLLPQVATSNKWDRNTFLEQVCIKAGLPMGSWKEKDADIYVFSAEVFGEH